MGLINSIKEEFTSVWTLLNDTSNVLARAKLFTEYEKELRSWRSELQAHGQNPEVTERVREQVKALRTYLRQQGLDLVLGQKDIVAAGWRHDDAEIEGFRRCVVLITDQEVFWISGTENHNLLKSGLERKLGVQDIDAWPGLHSLWFRWVRNTLEFSGADSEPKDRWDEFRKAVDEKKNFLIKRLKNLR